MLISGEIHRAEYTETLIYKLYYVLNISNKECCQNIREVIFINTNGNNNIINYLTINKAKLTYNTNDIS